VRDVLSAVLLLTGVLLAVVAALGLVRLPDVFSRMHAATKPSTLGLLLITVGAALQMEQAQDAVKLLLVAAFTFLTAPVAAHMIGRAAYRSGAGARGELVVDDLRGVSGPPPAAEGRAQPQPRQPGRSPRSPGPPRT
jgi:multicomponent Na+:H+ antiporter subunit G